MIGLAQRPLLTIQGAPSRVIAEKGMTEFDERGFRDALGSFPTGVTVVTTRDPQGRPVAMTVSSFTSVSLDPPLILWCVNRAIGPFEAFNKASHFAVHVLQTDQTEVSNHFAVEREDKFQGVEYDEGLESLPILRDYNSLFQCKVEHRYGGGDHVILVGRVLDFEHRPVDPLVFHGGGYRTLT
jgi:3-hydroxy-9,10-secoandrosta-1,3,5(10)-triene-9,17-dione monooxygenase reductase component